MVDDDNVAKHRVLQLLWSDARVEPRINGFAGLVRQLNQILGVAGQQHLRDETREVLFIRFAYLFVWFVCLFVCLVCLVCLFVWFVWLVVRLLFVCLFFFF